MVHQAAAGLRPGLGLFRLCSLPGRRARTRPPLQASRLAGLPLPPRGSAARAAQPLSEPGTALPGDDAGLDAQPDHAVPRHWTSHLHQLRPGERRALRRHFPTVAAINTLEPAMQALSDEQLRELTTALRGRVQAGEPLLSLLPEAFAAVREASQRVLGMRPYDVQLIGGAVLAEGVVAEMKTGEGKTLVAALPAYLYALTGRGVHVVTVNDYLAQRDAAWIGKVFVFLGLSVGVVTAGTAFEQRPAQFGADITYVTAYDVAFTYLQDNLAVSAPAVALRRPLHFAIVDEVDSILLDECRNPFIINRPDRLVNWGPAWRCAVEVAKRLQPPRERGTDGEDDGTLPQSWYEGEPLQEPLDFDFVSDPRAKLAVLTQRGMQRSVQALAGLKQVALAVRPGQPHGPLFAVLLAPQADGRVEVTVRTCQRPAHTAHTATRAVPTTTAPSRGEDTGELPDDQDVTHLVDGDAGVDPLLRHLGLEALPLETVSPAQWHAAAPAVLWAGGDRAWGRFLVQAVRATFLYQRDVDYLVRRGEVIIVDTATGRPRPHTRWQAGLHQALEAKEGVTVQGDAYDQGRITYQALFNYYERLAGMTGTAATDVEEFGEAYGLQVVRVPPHRPSRRVDHPPVLYVGRDGWQRRLQGLVREAAAGGRPVLLATASVEESFLVKRLAGEVAFSAQLDSSEVRGLEAALHALPARLPLSALPPDAASYLSEDQIQAYAAAYVSLADSYRGCVALLNRLVDTTRMGPYDVPAVEAAVLLLGSLEGEKGGGEVMTAEEERAAGRVRSLLTQLLERSKLKTSATINLLNAQPDQARKEAATIAQAGMPGVLTIATAMAGRGTDIMLGGNPKGLTLLALSWLLLPAMAPAAEDLPAWRPATPPLHRMSPPAFASDPDMKLHLPPRVFTAYQAARTAISQAQGAWLPGKQRGEGAASAEAAALFLAAELEATEVERALFAVAVKQQQTSTSAPGIPAGVAAIEAACSWIDSQQASHDSSWAGLSATQTALRRFALLQWLWFEQQCNRYAARVRAAGGLLVVITSLHDSRRVELQLRGRAGRQGDPGESHLISCREDPVVRATLMPSQTADLFQLLEKNGLDPGEDLPDLVTKPLIRRLTRTAEQQRQSARDTTRRFDAVIDPYRRHAYRLRRTLVLGGDAARAGLLHRHLRDLAAALVERYVDGRQRPAKWGPQLQALMQAVHALVNSPASAAQSAAREDTSTADSGGHVEGEFPSVAAAAARLPAGRAAAVRVGPGGGLLVGLVDVAPVPTAAALQEALVHNQPLPSAVAAGAAGAVPSRRRAAMQAARRETGGSRRVEGRRGGRHGAEVARLEEWLGDLLASIYERKRSLLESSLRRLLPATNALQAASCLRVQERDCLTACLDALWADFLQDVSTLQRAVQSRAFSNLDPLDEFKLEAADMFARLLRDFRLQAAAAALGGVDLEQARGDAAHAAGSSSGGSSPGRVAETLLKEVAWAGDWVKTTVHSPPRVQTTPAGLNPAEGSRGGQAGEEQGQGQGASLGGGISAASSLPGSQLGTRGSAAASDAGRAPAPASAVSDEAEGLDLASAEEAMMGKLFSLLQQASAEQLGAAAETLDQRWQQQQQQQQQQENNNGAERE